MVELEDLRHLECGHLLGRRIDVVQQLQKTLAVTTRARVRTLQVVFERGMNQADCGRQTRRDEQAFFFERPRLTAGGSSARSGAMDCSVAMGCSP